MACTFDSSRPTGARDTSPKARRRRWLWVRSLLGFGLCARIALGADTDGDGLDDGWELVYFGNLAAQPDGDPDGDGLTNAEEQAFGSDPTRFDSDGDGLSDARERDLLTNPTLIDTDADGLSDYAETQLYHTDPRLRDSDGGGRGDGEEVLIDGTNPLLATDDALDSDGDGLTNQRESTLGTNPFSADTDGDLLTDYEEDANHDGIYQGDLNENGIFEPQLGEETDPTKADTDGDGLSDGLEKLFGTDPFRPDSDGDGVLDGDEYNLRDRYACLSPAQADSDNDGLSDGYELAHGLDPCSPDSDGDGVLDPVEVAEGTDPTSAASVGVDTDGDGLTDSYELNVSHTDPNLADTDGDQLTDGEEIFKLRDGVITDPLDADTDDDGLLDGSESVQLGADVTVLTSAVKADTDGDGLSDGLERGLAAPEVSARDPGATDLSVFVADQDPSKTTDPNLADTDGDGLGDGAEDRNHDGRVGPSESDPNRADTDADGLPDGWEVAHPSCNGHSFDPADAGDATLDFDADGLNNQKEYELRVLIGLSEVATPTDPCDPDTDHDGLSDGVEAHSNYRNGQTNPTVADTDGDGIPDGLEDADHDGRRELALETDPTATDSDGDGLADGAEDLNHDGVFDPDETDPRRADTDGDGLDDGSEVQRYGTDPLLTDSDGDGIPDGVEAGLGGDADPSSHTDPRAVDTDGDGLADGAEDANHNGKVDADETDPTNRDTDHGGVTDGREVLVDDTNPLDAKDDIFTLGSDPALDPVLPPDAGSADAGVDAGDGTGDPRWALEPNGEIRGSSCSIGGAGAVGGPRPEAFWLSCAALLSGVLLRRRRQLRRSGGWLLGGALAVRAVAPSEAAAQQPTPDQLRSARNTNIDVNPYRINPAGFELLGTSRPRVLPHLGLRGAASFDYLSGPAVVADRSNGDTLRTLVGSREEALLGAALGLFDRYQVSLMTPVVFHQEAQLPGQGLGAASSAGFGNPTIVPRAVVLDGSDGDVSLGFELPVTVPLWNAPAYMGYDGWGIEPRLLSEEAAGPLVFSIALGALIKPERRIFNLRDADQLTYAIAGQYPEAIQGWDFGLEFQGATSLEQPGRSTETRGELLVGGRHRLDQRLSVTAGAGAGVMSGIGQPEYRVFLGLGYIGLLGAAPRPATPAPSKLDCTPVPGATTRAPACLPPDADQDGIPDSLDQCPNEPEDKDGFQDADGCPDPDNDGDGILDTEDGCPNEAEDRDGFKDADGCPDPDNDGDGILDANDKCPNEPGDPSAGPNSDGCPKHPFGTTGGAVACADGAKPTPTGQCLAQVNAGLIQIAEPVQFGAEATGLADASRDMLNQIVDILDANPNMRVSIEGHTDSWGPAARNLELSQQRANAVRTYLIRQSQNPNGMAKRLKAVGKGAAGPIESNESAVGRSRNRRVEFVIVSE